MTGNSLEDEKALVEIGEVITRRFQGRHCIVIISPEYEGEMTDTMVITDIDSKAGAKMLFTFVLDVWEAIVEERQRQEHLN